MPSPTPSPLLLTADPVLTEELARLCAASGSTPLVVGDASASLRSWSSASMVLVGSDLLSVAAGLLPPRRDHVHVVTMRSTGHNLWREALAIGAESLLELPGDGTWLVETLTDLADDGTTSGASVAVLGGSGGAGATTLACALGQYAARNGSAVVIDCDPFGPGVDRILGLEERPGYRWDALTASTGRLSARSLRAALPHREGLGALSWRPGSAEALPVGAVREALSAASRGHDTVVVDLPRSFDSVVDDILLRCDLTVLVARATVAGIASAARLRARIGPGLRVGLVLRGRGPNPEDAAEVVGAPLLAQMADQRGLSESIDLGLGPLRATRGPLARACAEVLG